MGLLENLLRASEKKIVNKVLDSSTTYEKTKNFDEKLQTILQNAGSYELHRNISPEELEQEFGQEIYTRGGGRCEPENITYGIYQGDTRILMIRRWEQYADYCHKANRQIKDYCDTNGVKILDFFDYLPNREDYMEQRIRNEL
jgi:hypothetical protein